MKQERLLKKNDQIELTIDSLGAEGEGIGHYDGYTLFVKDALPEEKILAKITKVKKAYGFARLEQILIPSPDRIEPICPVARQCGGCQLQHFTYEKQLAYKQKKVEDCFLRIGKLEKLPFMEPIIGMEKPYYYRNKAQYPVRRGKDGKIVIGFYAGRTHVVIDTTHCFIQMEITEKIIEIIKGFMEEFGILPYEEEGQTGLIRHILTRVGFVTKEVSVCIVINGEKLPFAEKLADRLFEQVEGMTSFCLNVNQENTNVILGKQTVAVRGGLTITDFIGKIKYQISPASFFQVNPVQTQKLYNKVLEYASLSGNEIIWDLYCGIGTISLFLAQEAKKVYGVEIVPEAIADAKENAKINGITNVEFFVGDAKEAVSFLPKPDVIVVDPPRKGCDESLIQTMLAVMPKKIVYVSCDPATLARDLRKLCDGGYEARKAQVVDQFGWTAHVETAVLLVRKP